MPEVTVRTGAFDEESLLAALHDEVLRDREPHTLVVSDREMELRAARILALGSHPLDALRAVMPRVVCAGGLPAGGWCLLNEEEASVPVSVAFAEEVGPSVQCSPAGTS